MGPICYAKTEPHFRCHKASRTLCASLGAAALPQPLGCGETLREDAVRSVHRQRAAVSGALGTSDEHGMVVALEEASVK